MIEQFLIQKNLLQIKMWSILDRLKKGKINMKKINITIESYEIDEEFRIDIVQDGAYMEAWFYSRWYPTKMRITGTASCTKEEYIEMITSKKFIDWEKSYYENHYM